MPFGNTFEFHDVLKVEDDKEPSDGLRAHKAHANAHGTERRNASKGQSGIKDGTSSRAGARKDERRDREGEDAGLKSRG